MQDPRRAPASSKQKLRTITDVRSRIKWAGDEDEHIYTKDDVILGYDDRIHGPLEKHLNDFVPLGQGGDLPEHRIWYVRCGKTILWDRLGRVDKLFASGEGRDAPISPETHRHVSEARVNMKRLEEEKRRLRALRERTRARKAKQRAARAAVLNSHADEALADNPTVASTARFVWQHTSPSAFAEEAWVFPDGQQVEELPSTRKLIVVTWNVLFDCYDLGETKDQTRKRWTLLIDELMTTDADIIALQEVTPEFLELLRQHPSAKQHYAASASPKAADSVTPSGNLLLWKKRLIACSSLHACIDGRRQRALVGVLSCRCQGTYIFGNVHLPGNKGEALRGDARLRELSAVLGQMQRLVSTSHRAAVPILLGDFNDHEDLIACSTKVDLWEAVHGADGDSGFTFNPQSNPRALLTRQLTGSSHAEEPKRIDRIIALRHGLAPAAAAARLIGKDHPPSDHYGVAVELQVSRRDIPKTDIASEENLWSGSPLKSPDTLLGLTLTKYPLLPDDVPPKNKTSTLPIPHITLLHGFVEIQSSIDLVKAAVADSLRSAGLAPDGALPTLSFDEMDVFEHSSSATLVSRPRDCDWLRTLYQTLHATFPQCHEQETRHAEGWTPHVSLGNFGTPSAAREFISALNLRAGVTETLDVQAITIYRRSPVDGKIFAAGVVPICNQARIPKNILKDAGRSQHAAFEGVAGVLRFEIERACEATAGQDSSSTLHVFGSHLLGASMPGFSDIDAVVQVTSNERNPSSLEFLHGVSSFLQARHPVGRFRIREAKSSESRLCILTSRLWPGAPAIDLQVAFRNRSNGKLVDEASRHSFGGVIDTLKLLESIQDEHKETFSGALRILKFWAHQRQVYGFGFLGGGGWGRWLSHILEGWEGPDCETAVEAAHQVVVYFFKQAAAYGTSTPLAITPPKFVEAAEEFRGAPLVLLSHHTENNLGRRATKSTTVALLEEVSRAARMLENGGISALKEIMQEIEPRQFPHSSLLEVGVTLSETKSGTLVADVKNHASQIILYNVVDLERRIGDPSRIRPLLKPTRKGDKFTWLILLQATEQDLGFEWTEKRRDEMRASLATYGVSVDVQIKIA